MRAITTHRVNPANDKLSIVVGDEPGAGGANHRYLITGFSGQDNPAIKDGERIDECLIAFQQGPIGVAGVNGVTHEALLAIIRDRLESYQRGDYKCEENEEALGCVKAAQRALFKRTARRVTEGKEGTHQV